MRRYLGLAAALLAAAAIAFAPALPGPFDFDDGPAIIRNATIRPDASALDVIRTPPLGSAASGRPVVNASFAASAALNRAFGVASPDGISASDAAAGFRMMNILFHVAAAVLLFALIDTLLAYGAAPPVLQSAHRTIAFIVALLWLVHPLQTEAVNYISQRTEVLASLFYLCATLASVRYLLAIDRRIDASATGWSAAAAIAALLGAGSKEIIATLPVVVAGLDLCFFGATWTSLAQTRSRRRLYVALIATALLSLVPDLFGARAGTVGTRAGITRLDYLISQGWVIPHYLRLAAFPTDLVYDYGQTPILGASAVIGAVAIALLAAVAVLLWRMPRWRPTGFLIIAFLVLLAPSSSVIPINTEIAAERRMYLALACVISGVVCGAVLLGQRFEIRARRAGGLLAIGVAGLLTIASARRSAMYRNPLLLWTSAMERFPSNARAYDNVGAALLREDWSHAPRADSLFARAIALDSAFLDPWRRRASIAVRAGRYEQAESFLEHMLSIAPADSDATATLSTLAGLYVAAAREAQAAGRFAEASERLTRALRLDARDPEAWTRLAMTRAELGDRAAALDAVRRALRVDPAYPPALQVLAVLDRPR